MPYWVKLTAAGEKPKPIFVNLENATLLEPRSCGTRIVFVGGDGDRAEVVEDSDLISTMEPVAHRLG
jgi:hypothetical protein